MYNFEKPGSPEELMHWGILGMKWGRRRYQNPDGSLTEAGKKRYGRIGRKATDKEMITDRANLVRDSQEKVSIKYNLQKLYDDMNKYYDKDANDGDERRTLSKKEFEEYRKAEDAYKKAQMEALLELNKDRARIRQKMRQKYGTQYKSLNTKNYLAAVLSAIALKKMSSLAKKGVIKAGEKIVNKIIANKISSKQISMKYDSNYVSKFAKIYKEQKRR